MPPVPEEMFLNAVKMTVRENIRWVPPIGKGALYVRPLLFGSGAILGVAPAPEFTFLVYVSPVGPDVKGGITPTSLRVSDEFHRAAPEVRRSQSNRKLCTRNGAPRYFKRLL